MARKRRGRVSRSKQNQAGKSNNSGGGGNNSGGGGGGGGNSGGGGGGGGGNNSGGGGGGGNNSGGGSKDSNQKKKTYAPSLKGDKLKRKIQQDKVKARFKDREARGLSGFTGGPRNADGSRESLSQYRNRQREQIRNNALGRQATFKTGIPSGVNLKAGSFGISEAGRAQAAANRAEAQTKRRYDKALSDLRARDPGMAKYISSLPANVRTDALIGGQTRAAGVELGIGLGTLAAGKAALGSLATTAAKGLGYKGVQAGFTGMGKTGFDAISKGAKYIASRKPQILGRGAYSSPSAFKVPGTSKLGAARYAGGTGSLGGVQSPGGIIKSVVPGRASRIGFIESQAKVPGATFDKGVQLANRLQAGAFPKSQLANTLRSQFSTGIAPGGGFGTGASNVFAGAGIGAAGTAAVKSGGLNLGGVDSGEDSDPTARVSGFRSVKPLGIAKEALLGFGDLVMRNTTDLDQLGRLGFGATTDKLKDAAKDMRINQVVDTLKKSPIRQAAVGFNYGIDVPDAIKQVDETRSVLSKTFKDFDGKDIDLGNIKPGSLDKNVKAEDLRGGISNVAYNLDRMPTLARGLSAFQKDTEGGGDKEFRKDLRFTFNRKVDAPTGIPGRDLMKATTPGIVNRVLSGKLKDMGQEAITQNNLVGGMTAGNFDTIASTLNKNLKTEGTIANTRKKELTALAERFGPGGGQAPTPKSILGGVNPFRRRTRTSNTPNRGQGGNTPVGRLPQVQNPAEVELPIIPESRPQQQGTDSNRLADIQNQAYQNTFNNLTAQFRPRYTPPRRRTFRTSFNREYFSQYV